MIPNPRHSDYWRDPPECEICHKKKIWNATIGRWVHPWSKYDFVLVRAVKGNNGGKKE